MCPSTLSRASHPEGGAERFSWTTWPDRVTGDADPNTASEATSKNEGDRMVKRSLTKEYKAARYPKGKGGLGGQQKL